MDSFWVKMAIFAVIVVGLIVLVKTISPKVEEAMNFDKQYEKTEKLAEQQEAKLQTELAEAERKAEQARSKPVKPKPADVRRSVQLHKPKEMAQEDQLRAQQLYQMAETQFRIGRKPLMTFHGCVKYCRELIEAYPDSPEAAKARVLLREIPERHRKQYNITDEEMGL